jgi:hypothetical protein
MLSLSEPYVQHEYSIIRYFIVKLNHAKFTRCITEFNVNDLNNQKMGWQLYHYCQTASISIINYIQNIKTENTKNILALSRTKKTDVHFTFF